MAISRSLITILGFELKTLANYTLEKIKLGERVVAHETTLLTLVHGSGNNNGVALSIRA